MGSVVLLWGDVLVVKSFCLRKNIGKDHWYAIGMMNQAHQF
jgi:hypothetical protein